MVVGLLEGKLNGLVEGKIIEDGDEVECAGVVVGIVVWLEDERGIDGED